MEIIKFLQSFSSPFGDTFFQFVTMLGEESIYVIFLGAVYWCYNKKFGYRLAFAFLFSSISNGAVKNIFKSPRPIGVEGIRSLRVETATGFSFPSGHTQAVTAFWTSVISKYKYPVYYVLAALMIVLVGISRLYLGVHWPIDVLGGAVLGFISVCIANSIFDFSEKSGRSTIILLLVIPSLAGLIFFWDSADYVKAVAVACSFYVGYVCEGKYIDFNEKCSTLKQVIKFLLGIAGILLIKVYVKQILPDNSLGYFIRYFMIGIWTTICAPLLFAFLGLVNKTGLRSLEV